MLGLTSLNNLNYSRERYKQVFTAQSEWRYLKEEKKKIPQTKPLSLKESSPIAKHSDALQNQLDFSRTAF